ncbi:allophanate hydrolase [Hyphomicrobium sp.]|uniref:allophanate hydrolase n=1 Tax=Hyphomicrobium sp. TaxID=82 RepID=UPI002D77E7C3|nr:allophanate hydrolase [Hyphomicrobium sp.]HET6390826.1 allophanate hydrolase [Hyphomicrobium sp.]
MTLSLDIAHLSALYEQGKITPEAVIEEVFARIAGKGVAPDWIALRDKADVLESVRRASRGPLYGIPFAVKDNIDVAGLPTTCACPAFAYTPERSATVVERLEAAGAILIGKTNLDQFATGLNGTRSPYGIPANVFNADYISGGSSSGSAVVVAAGLVSFSLGTDTAGSGRVPAGFNNIVGLKPTKGMISTRGVVPACKSQDAVSIFALTVGDAAKVAETAAAFDKDDCYARPDAPPFAVQEFARPLRVGIPNAPLSFFGDSEYQRLYHQTIDRLAALGFEITPFNFAPFRDTAAMLYDGPWVAERLFAADDLKDEDLNPVVGAILRGGKDKTALAAFESFYRLEEFRRAAEAEWKRMDVMVLPTAGTTYTIADMLADPIQLNSNLGAYTNFVNLLDLSALAVPAGFRADVIPFGVTLIGRAFEDGKLAALGDVLHRALEGAKLGGTETALAQTAPAAAKPLKKPAVQVAVVGAHLRGQPLNGQLTERNAVYLETARTAEGYHLYALPGTTPPKPGLVFEGTGPGKIEVEIWEMSEAAFGSFVALIPAPLGIGTLTLDDGRQVKGFLCESHALAGAEDITEFGGWRAWLNRTAVA